jgi:hypothetical protein
MRHRVCSYLLIALYTLSITAFGIMEAGHEIMHTLKNNIHYHEADDLHALEDHDVMVHDDQANVVDNLVSSLSLGFLFYESFEMLLIDNSGTVHYLPENDGLSNTFAPAPFSPPPIHPSI